MAETGGPLAKDHIPVPKRDECLYSRSNMPKAQIMGHLKLGGWQHLKGVTSQHFHNNISAYCD